jgi:hypothetical protein
MSGYAANARLQGGSLRLVDRRAIDAATGEPPARQFERRTTDPVIDEALTERAGRPLFDRLASRLDDLRETWSQMTFFLFDPDSWR